MDETKDLVDETVTKRPRKQDDTKWVALLILLALIIGLFFGWNLGESHWEGVYRGVYQDDVDQFKADIEEKYGLRVVEPLPQIYIHDLVGEDD